MRVTATGDLDTSKEDVATGERTISFDVYEGGVRRRCRSWVGKIDHDPWVVKTKWT